MKVVGEMVAAGMGLAAERACHNLISKIAVNMATADDQSPNSAISLLLQMQCEVKGWLDTVLDELWPDRNDERRRRLNMALREIFFQQSVFADISGSMEELISEVNALARDFFPPETIEACLARENPRQGVLELCTLLLDHAAVVDSAPVMRRLRDVILRRVSANAAKQSSASSVPDLMVQYMIPMVCLMALS